MTYTATNVTTVLARSVLLVSFILLGACVGGDGNNRVFGTDGNVSASGAPRLSGSPSASALPDNKYVFQPVATDADGDLLTFSVRNLPVWASFDKKTGRISGMPTRTDRGTYRNIVISVSDGKSTVSLPPFSIAVGLSGKGTGKVTLSWTPPASRADGGALSLSEIAGYTIYYGTEPGNYSNSIDINNSGTTTFTISDLPLGKYFFVLVTNDTNGLQSNFSNRVAKIAQ